MQMRLFQKLTPEPHVSFHLEEFSLPASPGAALPLPWGHPGFPAQNATKPQHKTKQNKTKEKKPKKGRK